MQSKSASIEEEAEVAKPVLRRRALSIVMVASITFMLSGVTQSFAECGGYCEARQTLTICHRAVTSSDLQTRERGAEFEKCKSDPLTYLAQPIGGGAQFGLD
jgi:hypothetical protein